ncbi:MAG: TlyA family RNA methyltransferase [Chloroflexi bacterium]|nr:TlyA family RNA methyltransferase [Chloroflexota bacterium]
MPKRRLDQILIDRGLAPTLTRARALIMAGRVYGRARVYDKPGMQLDADVALTLTPDKEFVSRGGLKLRAALEAWPVGVSGRVCADLGASTGGFTDLLLQHGAARVYAVDVGKGQLHDRLSRDARVVIMDGTNARALPVLNPPPDLVTVDLAFISVTAVLPAIEVVAQPGADVVVLVKPQFEVERSAVDYCGVVRDPGCRAAAIAVVAGAARDRAWRIGGILASPIRGANGNRECLLWMRTPRAKGNAYDR